jgi:hypothetical protein
MGMLGGILFASSQGAGLDAHAKQWRLAADVANDIGARRWAGAGRLTSTLGS